MSDSASKEKIASVAIIGMAGRFPGARSVDAFWSNLRDGVNSISFFSPEELQEAGVSPELIRHPNYVNARGVLAEPEWFDASFFRINAREAEAIDPQQRVFLECAWEALEASGYDPENFEGTIGLYAGVAMSTYFLTSIVGNQAILHAVGAYQVMLGNDKDYLTTRVSYKMNLKGPSVVIQTACSTSLVAVQTAYQALRDYQCDMAMAGGVSIKFPQKAGYLYQEGMILSADGRCRAFDAKAQGTVGGDGAGIVVMKRLEDALEAGDQILAVIRGAAINNDGSVKIGFTAPSVEGQAEVIAMAQSLAGIMPDTIQYIEAHGTGTTLGDPIEVAGLTRAFRMSTTKTGFCALGSVKTNIGHLDAAAGVAGLIKTVLALRHKQIPPSLHFERPNPEIDFASSPFYVNATLKEWEKGPHPRRAGISSFGMGGTNAHVVVEEAPERPPTKSHRTHHVLLLSAQTSEAMETATDNLVAQLTRDADLNLADVAYTLQVGRRHFSQRRMVVCCDRLEAARLLEGRDGKRVFSATHETGSRALVFLLSGQGSQHVNMARGIYENEPVFRRHLDHCAEQLETHLGLDLRTMLYPEAQRAHEAGERLRQTGFTQPALFAVDYALAKLWMAWGVRPQALLGHSLGEYAAACLAGVFSLDDALKLVAERGRMMQALPGGTMLSVPLGRDALEPLLGGDLSLAAVNSPKLCVVSGPNEAIDLLRNRLTREGIQCQRLHTSHAFHSAMMDPIVDSFVAKVAAIPLLPPTLPVMSNLTGTWLTPAEATDPAYWGRHLRHTVLFSDAVAGLLADPDCVLLEVGPGQALISLARQQALTPGKHVMLSTLPHPQDPGPDALAMFNTVGRLWQAGVNVDWQAIHADEQRRRVALPPYPFQRERYSVETPSPARDTTPVARDQAQKNPDLSRWFYIPSWRRIAPPMVRHTEPGREVLQNWLVCLDDLGLGVALMDRLRSAGHTVTAVRAGERFARTSEDIYVIDPGVRADHDALFEDLAARDRLPSRLLHLFTLTEGGLPPSDPVPSEVLQNLGFYSLLFSVQALVRVRSAHSLRVDVVSNHTQDVRGNEPISSDKAMLFGPCRVMPQEFGNLTCRTIDVALTSGAPGPDEALVSQIFAEITAESRNPVVALRDGHCWAQDFEPVSLPSGAATNRLREGGVYLITGGLGTIGLLLAKYIAKTVRAKFVLTSRSGLPPRSAWSSPLDETQAGMNLGKRIAAVREIEELGSKVMVLRADVAVEKDMQEVMSTIDGSFGALNGVIHAAGLPGPESFIGMVELDRARCERQLRPKVSGLRVLECVLQGKPLDFCLLTSSLSSVLGGIGWAAYSAADRFMDVFSHEQNRIGNIPWITIDWDVWLPANVGDRAGAFLLAMTHEEGLDTFARVIATDSLCHAIVSTVDLQARADLWTRNTAVPGLLKSKEEITSFLHDGQDLPKQALATKSDIEGVVARIWQDLLGLKNIGVHDNYFELGGQSLLATQLISRLRETFDVEIPLRAIFEAPTVGDMAGLIEARRWMKERAGMTDVTSGGMREEIDL